jgi:hypothetical protein
MTYETLTEQHKRFVDAYVACLNYRKAYQVAFPNTTYNSSRTLGSELARKPYIKVAIQEKLKEVSITKDDILGRMIQLLEFDITDYMLGDIIDFQELKDSGYGWLIKGIKYGKFSTELSLMDKDRTLENLAKIMQMFSDNNISINLGNELSSRENLDKKLKEIHEKLNAYEGGK